MHICLLNMLQLAYANFDADVPLNHVTKQFNKQLLDDLHIENIHVRQPKFVVGYTVILF